MYPLTQLTFCALAASSTALYLSSPGQEIITTSDYRPSVVENAVDPCTLAESSQVNGSIQLASWLECQINGFYPFPENTNWPENHATAFSKDLRFTFNDTHYDFDGSLKLYKSFNATLGKAFAPFKHGFINTLGIPNTNNKGGFVYMIGWAGGFQKRAKLDMYFTNAAFAVVKEEQGQRKIVEFRESSNIPNTAPLPEPNVWDCHFPKEKEELRV